MFLLASLAMVSLTCCFLMCEFDYSTGLIKFNLFICLFPNGAVTWYLGLILFKPFNTFFFSEQSLFSSN